MLASPFRCFPVPVFPFDLAACEQGFLAIRAKGEQGRIPSLRETCSPLRVACRGDYVTSRLPRLLVVDFHVCRRLRTSIISELRCLISRR